MKNVASILSLCAMSVLCLSIIGGCKSDSGPTDSGSGTNTYPTVAPDWRGTTTLTNGTKHDMVASFIQNLDKLQGYCLWMSSGSALSVENYEGSITTSRKITATGTGVDGQQGAWPLLSWNATLSNGGDTISGSVTLSNASPFGTFVLVKKIASGTYSTVAKNWAGRMTYLTTWNMTANFKQSHDILVGRWIVTVGSSVATEYFHGELKPNRQIDLKVYYSETFPLLSGWIPTVSASATLSANADTISGTWRDAKSTGSVVLVKQ